MLDPNEEGLWIIPPFQPQPAAAGAATPQPAEAAATQTSAGRVAPEAGAGVPGVAGKTGKQVRRIVIKGNVPLDSWADIFRSFVNPAARMNPKRLRLGIDFEIETGDGQPLDESDPAFKAMKEAARQLGLEIEAGE